MGYRILEEPEVAESERSRVFPLAGYRHRSEVARYQTGAAAYAFRTGKNGSPGVAGWFSGQPSG